MNKPGLIGNNINYSLSPIIHNYLFKKYDINANYQIYNQDKFDITQVKYGNVTIPYKKKAFEIAKYSNFNSKSINTFKVENGIYKFMSTDEYGIIDSIEKLQIKYMHTRIHVIIGDGATSDMLTSVLQTNFNVFPGQIYVVSRKYFNNRCTPKIVDQNYILKNIKANYVLYNTTPLGNGELADRLACATEIVKNAISIFDLSYNPQYNKLAKTAYNFNIKYINGLNMLIVQALHAFTFWTNIDVNHHYIDVKKEILFKNCNKLIVCAMPFAGKTTLYRRRKTKCVDLDAEVSKYTNYQNAHYITKHGINQFRKIEAQVLKKQLSRDDIKVIFLGGGTLTNSDARVHLANHIVVYMRVRLELLIERFDQTRANIQTIDELKKIYSTRDYMYNNIASFSLGAKSTEVFIDEYLDY